MLAALTTFLIMVNGIFLMTMETTILPYAQVNVNYILVLDLLKYHYKVMFA